MSESGYYDALSRPPSVRAIRQAWLTDQIRAVHALSNGTYGARRMPAELTLGRGLAVPHGAIELLMSRAGTRGVTGRPRWQLDGYRSVDAMIESFWSRMQIELLNRRRWNTRIELANALFEYLEIWHDIWHDRRRRHSAPDWRTPLEFETQNKIIVA